MPWQQVACHCQQVALPALLELVVCWVTFWLLQRPRLPQQQLLLVWCMAWAVLVG
jgi:hypothetical protein